MTDSERELLMWLADYVLFDMEPADPRRAELGTLIEAVPEVRPPSTHVQQAGA